MKRLIFLTLSTLCAGTFAQVPDYVPTDGWFNGGAGSDWSGFSGLPGGRRQDSGFHESGLAGFWWSANADGTQIIVRVLDEAYDQVGRYIAPSVDAYSIRCIKDAE